MSSFLKGIAYNVHKRLNNTKTGYSYRQMFSLTFENFTKTSSETSTKTRGDAIFWSNKRQKLAGNFFKDARVTQGHLKHIFFHIFTSENMENISVLVSR